MIDELVVIKSDRVMMAYSGNKWIKTYSISSGKNPIGDKQFQGGGKTPEGILRYLIKPQYPVLQEFRSVLSQ